MWHTTYRWNGRQSDLDIAILFILFGVNIMLAYKQLLKYGLGALGLLGLWGPAIALAPAPVRAGTCASQCGPKPVKFVPGSRVEVEVVNQTASILLLEEVEGSDPIPVAPSRSFRLTRQGGTIDNSSVVFWDTDGFPVKVQIKQPQENLLRIEVLPEFNPPGDRSVYLRDDGSVAVLYLR